MSDSREPDSYTLAASVEQAVAASGEFRAGGTDLQERLRSGVTSGPLIDIFALDALKGVERSGQGTRIGALMTLAAIGRDEGLQRDYPALVLPAQTIATPQVRNSATLGGALCQRTRCGYYRHPQLGCPKKGNSDVCPARDGDHHAGVVFDLGPCVHPHPSSIGCALSTYEAMLDVNGRGTLSISDFLGDGDGYRDNELHPGELVTAVRLPPPCPGERAAYFRQMSREHAEWPMVEVVVRLGVEASTIVHAAVAVGAVANVPLRLGEVEEHLLGKDVATADLSAAAALSIVRCKPLPGTRYKVPMVEAGVLEALERAVAHC